MNINTLHYQINSKTITAQCFTARQNGHEII